MAAEVMDRVGIHEGNVFKYHQARRNTKNYQVDLETLQYDLLYGKQYTYDGENPFERTKMRMGIYDTTLDSIQVVSEMDHTYYIQGTKLYAIQPGQDQRRMVRYGLRESYQADHYRKGTG